MKHPKAREEDEERPLLRSFRSDLVSRESRSLSLLKASHAEKSQHINSSFELLPKSPGAAGATMVPFIGARRAGRLALGGGPGHGAGHGPRVPGAWWTWIRFESARKFTVSENVFPNHEFALFSLQNDLDFPIMQPKLGYTTGTPVLAAYSAQGGWSRLQTCDFA